MRINFIRGGEKPSIAWPMFDAPEPITITSASANVKRAGATDFEMRTFAVPETRLTPGVPAFLELTEGADGDLLAHIRTFEGATRDEAYAWYEANGYT